ncbi:uncharacterized protein N7511_009655 [Penicillium nucicola]|uniref:uncharacterized protein n=1 Tax=Penicillium nucicola TaxID=1850975 RepID=UPI0025451148|nr:uncharacterized protein N7511_009655 [Penicillium nucicola]KAJ5747959.1 hypothetical protein N7511_009655 [Penicillium nucicola]
MGRARQAREKSGSAISVSSRNRSWSTRAKNRRAVLIADRPCQRCFLHKEKNPGHICLRRPNRKACLHCRGVHKKCIEIPHKIKPAVDDALKLKGLELTEEVRAIHQRIKDHVRSVKVARKRASKRLKNANSGVKELEGVFQRSLRIAHQ